LKRHDVGYSLEVFVGGRITAGSAYFLRLTDSASGQGGVFIA
jgi:hypothetical protein